jgi:2'-5' RNA ligase
MRLFVAIDLPDALTEAVAAAQEPFRDAPGVNPVDPSGAHLTLKFLGDVAGGRVAALEDAIEDAVDAAGVGPFDATVGGYGVFPSTEYISVVWTGFREGGPEATRLHEAIERETTALGFDPEDHEFTPHVTLARVNDGRSKELLQRTVREGDPDVGRFRVESVRLKESTLTPEGPEYATVTRFAL